MRIEPTCFFSDGLHLDGAFCHPDDAAPAPAPLVVPCSGFTGLASIHPARFARSLTTAGVRCFIFDYRGFAKSEGERNRVLLEEQVRDILHAAAFAASDARVDAQRVVLLGWGMGAGLVLDAARSLTSLAGVAAINGFYDGVRFQRAHRTEEELAKFIQEVDAERAERSRTGESRWVDPFDIYPLDPDSRNYVENTLKTFDHYASERYAFELAESILRWRPEAHAPAMRAPLLVAHGEKNALHPPGEARALHDAYGGEKELFFLEDAGHTEFMDDDDPRYQRLADRVVEFITRIVKAA